MKLEVGCERAPGSDCVVITVRQGEFYACCRISGDALASLSKAALIDGVARQVVDACNLALAGG